MGTTDTPLNPARLPGQAAIPRKAKAYLASTKPGVTAQDGDVSDKGALKVFHGSISCLTLLSVALAVDPFVGTARSAG